MELTYKGYNLTVPYDVIQVEDLDIVIGLNDHSYMKIKLLIKEDKIIDNINKSIANEKIILKQSGKNAFVGKISKVNIIYEGNLQLMEVECVSYTKELDIKKRKRTFCDLDMKYTDVIDRVLKSYSNAKYRDEVTQGSVIPDFLLQYEETDFEFLKRLASHFGAVLVPDCTVNYPRFYFGLPDIDNKEEIMLSDYEVWKDLEAYDKESPYKSEDIISRDYTEWEVESDSILKLGEKVKIDGYIDTIVSEIHIDVYKSEIRRIYVLKREEGIETKYETNRAIFGMSLKGVVKEVSGNNLSVDFDIEEEPISSSNEKFFTYSIESSAWYCMPEAGSEVHIYFPTNYESDAIAIHAIRNTGSNSKYASKTQNPDIKSFSNTTGSEMQLSPSDMNFAADDSKSIALNLNQGGDITVTGNDISITAKEDILIGAGGDIVPKSINITAGQLVKIVRDDSSNITIDNNCNLNAQVIKYFASKHDAVELPKEIAEYNSNCQEEIDDINKQAKKTQIAKIEEAKSKFGFGAMAAVIGGIAIGAAIVCTGGAALVAVAAIGAASVAVGVAEMSEATQDYGKAQKGDYSQSFNFIRDTVFQGNQDAYDIFKYGVVLAAGVATVVVTGGASLETFMKIGSDMAMDFGFNLIADYIDDGSINNGWKSYMQSMSMSGGLCSSSTGIMNQFGKYAKGLQKAGKIASDVDLCKYMNRARMISDAGFDMLGDLAYTGDINPLKSIATSYVTNKLFSADPVDVATGSLYVPSTDVVLPDIDEEFIIKRMYDSTENRVGVFGQGWKMNYETFVYRKGNRAEVLCEDGHKECFIRENNEWKNEKSNAKNYILVEDNDEYNLIDSAQRKKYVYDRTGRLHSIINKHNNVMNVSYNGNYIDYITTFSNCRLYFDYKDNKIIQIKDDLGRVVQYIYNNGYLTEVVHVDRGITRYSYDDKGYITSITDQNGHTYTRNVFDNRGRVIREDYPNGDACIINYNDADRETTFYYEQSNIQERYRYNSLGLVTHCYYEDGSYEEYRYDEHENKIYTRDRNGNETKREYDDYGNIIKEIFPNGLIKEYYYDDSLNLEKQIDNGGSELYYSYDKNNNIIERKEKISLGKYRVTRYEYDSYGRIVKKNENNNITKYSYTSDNDIIMKEPTIVTTNGGNAYKYEYDRVGRNTAIITDYGKVTFGYNNLDYITSIVDAQNNKTIKTYDKMGNLINFYPPNSGNNGYSYSYDYMDRLIKIKNPLNEVKRIIRDSQGNIIKEVNPNYYDYETDNGIGTSYVYDKNNRKIKVIYASGGIERFFYDNNGNVIKHISPEYYNEETDDGLGYSYTYDSMNNLISIANEKGEVERKFTYDLHGNIIKETDISGNVTMYSYDLVGNIIEKRVPVDCDEGIRYSVTSYMYDTNNNKICERQGISLVEANDICNHYNEIRFSYDEENRLKTVEDKYGSKVVYKYDCLNQKIYESNRINDKTTKVIRYNYDSVGNLKEKKEEIRGEFISPDKKINSIWSITEYEYDGNGNVTKIITPNGYEIRRKYDEADKLIEEVQEDKQNGILRRFKYTYDKNENILAIEDSSLDVPRVKKYRYDTSDRLTHYINELGNVTRLFYDKNNRIIKEVKPEQYNEELDDGLGRTYSYNIQGQVTDIRNSHGKTIQHIEYDKRGQLKELIDGENNKIEYTYNLLGKIKEIKTPNAQKKETVSQSYRYDGRGNIIGIEDGLGNKTSYTLDDWGRIIEIITPEGGVEKYEYDYAGNITSSTDANGGRIQYIYNSLNLVSEIIDQEGNSEYFYYDGEGNLIKHIDRNENVVDRSYNIDKNVVSVKAYKVDKKKQEKQKEKAKEEEKKHSSYYMMVKRQLEAKKAMEGRGSYKLHDEISDEEKIDLIEQRYKYNKDGTLKNTYFNNMEYQYKYNELGLLESKSCSGKTLLEYRYNKNNKIKSIRDISGKRSIYEYDEEDRVICIKDNEEKVSAEYEYYNNDKVKKVVLGNGIETKYTYDGEDNVTRLITVTPSGEVLIDYKYAYDLNGNRIEKIGNKHKTYYGYDSMNRVVEGNYDGRKEEYTYDKVGNRLTKTTNEVTEKYCYNIKNQLKEVYKEEGNSNNIPCKIWSFTYDKQDNTIKEETNIGSNNYEYNCLNQQIKATTKEGNTLVNRYDSEGLRYEIEENENLSRFIFNKNGDILVETDKEDNVVSRFTRGYDIVSANVEDKKYYYNVDEQGSTNLITDKYGKINNEYWYDAFGNILSSKENIHNRITYIGQQYDRVTNQYYLRARYYNPVIGRFTQEDVYRGDGLNLYAYCNNNPVEYCDPSGYAKKICKDGGPKENNHGSEGVTYYHVTTAENAQKIIESGELKNGKWEAYVFAWTKQPTKKQASIAGIGTRSKVIIEFKTNASFVPDSGNIGKNISNIVLNIKLFNAKFLTLFDVKSI